MLEPILKSAIGGVLLIGGLVLMMKSIACRNIETQSLSESMKTTLSSFLFVASIIFLKRKAALFQIVGVCF